MFSRQVFRFRQATLVLSLVCTISYSAWHRLFYPVEVVSSWGNQHKKALFHKVIIIFLRTNEMTSKIFVGFSWCFSKVSVPILCPLDKLMWPGMVASSWALNQMPLLSPLDQDSHPILELHSHQGYSSQPCPKGCDVSLSLCGVRGTVGCQD